MAGSRSEILFFKNLFIESFATDRVSKAFAVLDTKLVNRRTDRQTDTAILDENTTSRPPGPSGVNKVEEMKASNF